jgi:hypothetical protein
VLVVTWFVIVELMEGFLEVIGDNEGAVCINEGVADVTRRAVDVVKEGAKVIRGAPQLGCGTADSTVEVGSAEIIWDIVVQIDEARGNPLVSVANVIVISTSSIQRLEANCSAP